MASEIPPGFNSTIKMNWLDSAFIKKAITVFAVLLFGGGGVAAWDVATKSDVQVSIQQHTLNERFQADARYGRINTVVERQGRDISKIKTKVDEISTVQRQEIARHEARRLTASIKDRKEREHEYDRLLERNLRRLEAGRDPCSTLVCDN